MESEKRTWPPSFGGSPLGKDRVVAAEIGELLERERLCELVAATDSMMRALYPNGIASEHMADAFGILRVLDQLVQTALLRRQRAQGRVSCLQVSGGRLVAHRVDVEQWIRSRKVTTRSALPLEDDVGEAYESTIARMHGGAR